MWYVDSMDIVYMHNRERNNNKIKKRKRTLKKGRKLLHDVLIIKDIII